jgi:hypothetical protein
MCFFLLLFISASVKVACERYDAKALFKHWDTKFITTSASFLAYGSKRDETIRRALGLSMANAGSKVLPIAGCVPAAVIHCGKLHAMSVSFPSRPEDPKQFFAFESPETRDAFMGNLQTLAAQASADS